MTFAGPPKPSVAVNDQSGASYALTDDDDGKIVRMSNAGANTVNVPSALKEGFSCLVQQVGAGQTTIATGVGAPTLQAADGSLALRVQFAIAGVSKTAASIYAVNGDLA